MDIDTLFNEIEKCIKYYRLPKGLKKCDDLKTALNLKNDKIPLEQVPRVEDLLKVNINLSGSVNRISTKSYKMTCNLNVIGENVELITNETDNCLLKGIAKFKQNLVYYYYPKNEPTAVTFDGSKYETFDFETFQEMKKNKFGKNCFIH